MAIKVEKPWGYEEILINNGRYVIKRLFVIGGHRLSLQSHKVKSETLLVYSGWGVIWLGDQRLPYGVHPRDLPEIVDISTPGTVHRIEATVNSVIYEVSTPELDDVVRLEDDYGRA